MIYRPTDRAAQVVLPPKQLLKILLVEDDPVDAELIEDFLDSVSINIEICLKIVPRLSDALDSLVEADFDAILLDLSLPDSVGLDTIRSIKAQVSAVPIVVLSSMNDESMAIEVVRCGAQDYLVKRGVSGQLLVRSLQYAIARSRTEAMLVQITQRERLLGRMIERIRSSIISSSLASSNLDCPANLPVSILTVNSIQLANILHKTVAEVRQFFKIDRVIIYRCDCSNMGEEGEIEEEETGVIIASDGSFNSYSNIPNINDPLDFSCKWISRNESILLIEDIGASQLDLEGKRIFTEFNIKAGAIIPIGQSFQVEIGESNSQINSQIWGEKEIDSGQNGDLGLSNLRTQKKLWGVMAAYHCSSSRQWQQWEIDFLQQLANQVAIAIEQSELYRQLEVANCKLQRLATTDELTGIANRRQFNRALNLEWQQGLLESTPLSLILCDIDFFKLYNDRWGHPAGDSCLVKVAEAIATSLQRPKDLAARYGGEEFIVLLPNTNTEKAIAIAKTIRTTIEILQLPHPQSLINPYITLSFGIASTIPNSHNSPETLIQSADLALYQAKAQGRNRICQAFP
ncbi:diguanylate cyclase [Oscillatoriales cyanobacterium USR001]|nr:diguanylate cyclase [Oscillatoriales cyanobacterium USR001]